MERQIFTVFSLDILGQFIEGVGYRWGAVYIRGFSEVLHSIKIGQTSRKKSGCGLN